MLTLVFGRFVSEAMVNGSLDLGLIAKETTMIYGHKFVFTHVLRERREEGATIFYNIFQPPKVTIELLTFHLF